MWGASKSQGYEEEQNFPPPAHHCWCPLATKGLQFAAEWCRARASAWSSWKSQQAQLQLTCQKLPLPTKVYLTNSSGVTDHLVPVVTTKALVCYQHYVSAYVYLYIYIYTSLSLSTYLQPVSVHSTLPTKNQPPNSTIPNHPEPSVSGRPATIGEIAPAPVQPPKLRKSAAGDSLLALRTWSFHGKGKLVEK